MIEPTAGPYEVSDERGCDDPHFASVISHAPDARGVEIAQLHGGAPYRDGEGMANATLLAAAWTMLQALLKVEAHHVEQNREKGRPEERSLTLALVRAAIAAAGQPCGRQLGVDRALLAWAVHRWRAEVMDRPLENVHRRALDETWRQVIRYAGGDPEALLGPAHDDLLLARAPS